MVLTVPPIREYLGYKRAEMVPATYPRALSVNSTRNLIQYHLSSQTTTETGTWLRRPLNSITVKCEWQLLRQVNFAFFIILFFKSRTGSPWPCDKHSKLHSDFTLGFAIPIQQCRQAHRRAQIPPFQFHHLHLHCHSRRNPICLHRNLKHMYCGRGILWSSSSLFYQVPPWHIIWEQYMSSWICCMEVGGFGLGAGTWQMTCSATYIFLIIEQAPSLHLG